jgi:hypothetical protein
MMEQSLNGMFRPSSLDARCDERRQASPDVPPIRRSFRRAETSHTAPRTVIRRIVAAIGLWRARARSRQQQLRGCASSASTCSRTSASDERTLVTGSQSCSGAAAETTGDPYYGCNAYLRFLKF